MGKALKRQLSGVENWPVTKTEEPYIEAYSERKQDLVRFLSPLLRDVVLLFVHQNKPSMALCHLSFRLYGDQGFRSTRCEVAVSTECTFQANSPYKGRELLVLRLSNACRSTCLQTLNTL